jgi:uncharacterized protein (TIGR03083 family)
MAWLRVETVSLFPDVRRSLTDLLRELGPSEWAAPTVCGEWRVGDIAAHLLDVDLGKLSRARDGVALGPPPGVPLAAWLADHSQAWISACRRLSPAVLADLVEAAGQRFDDYLATLDLDALGESVSWASPRPAPVWMDVAREFSERWVHQQQIREAVGQPGLDDARLMAPVLGTFVHAVPVALAGVAAPEGWAVNLRVEGDGGSTWHAIRWHSEWDLWPGPHSQPVSEVRTTTDNAWRLFTNHPGAVAPQVTGDPLLGAALAQATAIIA